MFDEATLLEWIGEAQRRDGEGDRAGARASLFPQWEAANQAGDAYARCVLAHFLAHLQETPIAQRDWHLEALRAAEQADDARVARFAPSLHGNLAEVYVRLGHRQQARRHLDQALGTADCLGDDAYGELVRGLLARLTTALTEPVPPK